MKVILRDDIAGLGQAGDIREVKEGYARNYLLPQKKVMEATSGNLKIWEKEKQKIEKIREEQIKKAKDYALELEKISCTITAKIGEGGKLFGSVTNAHIAHSLEEAGHKVEKRNILLAEPIKELGAYFVEIRVHPLVNAKVKVWIVEENKDEKEIG